MKSAWSKLVAIGISKAPLEHHEHLRRTNATALGYALFGCLYTVGFLAFGLWKLALLNVISSLCTPLIVSLNGAGYYRAARIVQTLSFSVTIGAALVVVGGHVGAEAFFFPALMTIFVNFEFDEKKEIRTALMGAALIMVSTYFLTTVTDPIILIPSEYVHALSVSFWAASIAIFISQAYTFFVSMDRAKKELKSSQAHTYAILESVGDSFYFVGRDWRILYTNPRAALYFRSQGKTDPTGFDFRSFVENADDKTLIEKLSDSMETGKIVRYEFLDQRDQRWVELRGDPSPLGMSVSFADIDERKRTEIALQENEQLQRAIFDQAATGLNVLSPDGVFIRVNEAMCRMLDMQPQELIGKRFTEITAFDDVPTAKEDLEALMSGRIATMTKNKKYRHRLGHSVPANLQVSVIRDPEGKPKYLVSAVQDLTEAKLAEQKLVQASKMSSLGEMAGSIAHEINNPLAIIQLSAEQLEEASADGPVSPELALKVATRIGATVTRVSKIIRGLKAFSRNAEQDPMSFTPLSTIVESTLELCSERFKSKNILLRLAPIPDVAVMCRETELSQVFLNVLNNAFDAIEDASPTERWVELNFSFDGKNLSLAVTDSGPGIPEPIVDRILEPFYSTKPVGKGTGLGLSISKGIMETHGGRIYLDRESANTRFVLEIEATPLIGAMNNSASERRAS